MHIQDPEERRWIQERVETALRPSPTPRSSAHPGPAQRRRGVRDVPADQVRGAAALLARGRRVADPAAGRDPADLRRGRARRGRHRHGPPRPAQRAGQHRRQAVREDLLRVRGAPRPEVGARLRRRQVPPGPDRQVHHPDGEHATTVSRGRQPVAPGGGRPGARGHRAGQAGPHRPQARGLHGPAAAGPRRRRVRRPGRGRRDAEPVAAARLPHRRHRARRRQQPGRLHHRARSTRARRCTPPTSPA